MQLDILGFHKPEPKLRVWQRMRIVLLMTVHGSLLILPLARLVVGRHFLDTLGLQVPGLLLKCRAIPGKLLIFFDRY